MLNKLTLTLFLILSFQWRFGYCNDDPLQKVIDELPPHSTFKLPKGVHQGPILLKTPGINLQGETGTVITGNGKGSVVVITAPQVTVQNLTITGSGKSYEQADAGIAVRNADQVKILGNTIKDCLFGIDIKAAKHISIRDNRISSRQLEIGLRGDAIRLWSVESAQVEDNNWSHSRDTVAWYSKDILFKGNKGSDSRYSLHSMYSQDMQIQNNNFIRNRVGIFLMYGNNFIITNNHIERALGATGMGIGLKESSNILAQNNTIYYSAVGILIDNSPYLVGSRNWIQKNKLAFNGKAVVLSNDMKGGEYKQNIFLGNLLDVDSDNRKASNGLWLENYWDKYLGFDEDNNGTGDTPYVINKFGDTLRGSNPALSFFHTTPLFTLVETMEEVANLSPPIVLVVDKRPRLKIGEVQ